MDDTWFRRDLPVLDEIVRRVDTILRTGIPNLYEIAEATGMPLADGGDAAYGMHKAGLIDLGMTMTGGDPGPWHVMEVSAAARIAVGAGPSPENLAERVVVILEQQAENEPDAERRTRLRAFLGGAETARSTAVDILSGAIAKTITGG